MSKMDGQLAAWLFDDNEVLVGAKMQDGTERFFAMMAAEPADLLAATPTEINRAADVSARLVAAGEALAVTVAAHDGKTILLDTAAGSTCTLPAATGSGARMRFAVSVKATSNQHRITVTGNDAFVGSYNILDMDAAAQGAYAAAADADQFNLNGTTTGGLVGDWVEVQDIAADKWLITGQLCCPAGSNPATSFATGQVT